VKDDDSSSTAREFDAWFVVGATYKPPTTDADGNPLDDWEPR
jgi:hypothetical protein